VDELPFNPSPRRIWLGSTVPGKKMVKTLGQEGLDAGHLLLDLYKDEPHKSLRAVAYALREVSAGAGAFGPAARDLTKSITPGPGLFGALFTDIRDFLKLRFRATGAISSFLGYLLRHPEGVGPGFQSHSDLASGSILVIFTNIVAAPAAPGPVGSTATGPRRGTRSDRNRTRKSTPPATGPRRSIAG